MEDIEAIKQLKARYFRGMDTKQWDAMREVFAEDVHVDMEYEGGGIQTDRDSFMSMLRQNIEDVTTVHHGHMPEITLTSPTTAAGIWAMEDMLRWPEGAPIKAMHGYGHYHETYEKGADGQWRIKTMTLTRLRVDWEMPES
jgi:hypothetical protein